MFGHMLIERGQTWFAEILRLSLTESRDLQINPRNCIGTVLALNGHRKYFCMYHAKHPETMRGSKVRNFRKKMQTAGKAVINRILISSFEKNKNNEAFNKNDT